LKNKKDILIAGFGSEILMDDGIACRLVNKLKCRFDNNTFDYLIEPVGSLELIEKFKGYQYIFIIDSIMTNYNVPGNLTFYKSGQFTETINLTNKHDIALHTVISTARALNLPITENIYLITIEGKEFLRFGENFSEDIENKFDVILNEVANYIRKKIKKHHIYN